MRLRFSNTPSSMVVLIDPELAAITGIFEGWRPHLAFEPHKRLMIVRSLKPEELPENRADGRRRGREPTAFRPVYVPSVGPASAGWLIASVRISDAMYSAENVAAVPLMGRTEFEVLAAAEYEILAQWPPRFAPPRITGAHSDDC